MSVMTSPPYHRAVEWVLEWCEFYTRGIEPETAKNRREEIVSDLYEHAVWADEANVPPARVRRSILWRAARGVPADLSWRNSQRKDSPDMDAAALRTLRLNGTATALALAASVVLVVFGSYVIGRTLLAVAAGTIAANSSTFVAVAISTGLAIIGMLLLLRERTRFVGALWMIVPVIGILHFGVFALYDLSATVGGMIGGTLLGSWEPLTTCLIAGVALCFISAAVAWAPVRAKRVRS